MSHFRFIFAFVLAGLWLPVTSHCALEEAGLIDEVACDGAAADDASRCGRDSCSTVEASHYRMSHAPTMASAPVLLLCGEVYAVIPPAETIIVAPIAPERTDCPPELPRTWHFVARAALPVRAPSVVS